ncbi:hypothetical protein [Allosphingosinicella sp.]|jgi:hypothetical protein|uniref:hypothetical protein n=1 Tax=Allosphingosinicella sp. TaxID=2823234 RepID=UPI002EE29717
MKIAALRVPILGILLALVLSACTVTLVSPYDEQTDQMTTALQRAMSLHFEELRGAEAPACTHENFRGFYRERRVEIGSLDLRARSIPRNSETVAQVEGLAGSLNALEQIHQNAGDTCLSAARLSPIERGFQQQFLAILTLELAKKRGAD